MIVHLDPFTPKYLRDQLFVFLQSCGVTQDTGKHTETTPVEVPGGRIVVKFAKFIGDRFTVLHHTQHQRVYLIPLHPNKYHTEASNVVQ